MSKRRYKYYQPNKKDIKDKYGDCQIRALTKALDCSWLEAFDKTIDICREEQVYTIFGAPVEVRTRMLDKLGFDYYGISNKKGKKRPTVDSFAKEHPKGTYICNVANHEVAVVDGKYYDTWDSGDCSLYGYFEKRTEPQKEEKKTSERIKVNKAEARRLFIGGQVIHLCPSKLEHILDVPISIKQNDTFDHLVNNFEYCKCNSERGSYAHYYIKEGEIV